ncbi:MAG: hypothetical protein JXB32_24870 [Deltaproteobacteria bacterium]|nr:hypothetical protein [Deltaproteobacteria bacterium]
MKCPNCDSEMRIDGTSKDGTVVYACVGVDCGARLRMPPAAHPKIVPATTEASELLKRLERVELSIRVLQGDSADRVKEIHELRRQVADLRGRVGENLLGCVGGELSR